MLQEQEAYNEVQRQYMESIGGKETIDVIHWLLGHWTVMEGWLRKCAALQELLVRWQIALADAEIREPLRVAYVALRDWWSLDLTDPDWWRALLHQLGALQPAAWLQLGTCWLYLEATLLTLRLLGRLVGWLRGRPYGGHWVLPGVQLLTVPALLAAGLRLWQQSLALMPAPPVVWADRYDGKLYFSIEDPILKELIFRYLELHGLTREFFVQHLNMEKLGELANAYGFPVEMLRDPVVFYKVLLPLKQLYIQNFKPISSLMLDSSEFNAYQNLRGELEVAKSIREVADSIFFAGDWLLNTQPVGGYELWRNELVDASAPVWDYPLLLLQGAVALALLALLTGLARAVGHYPRFGGGGRAPTASYECGFTPFAPLAASSLFLFYRMAVFFVVFEAELVFLLPWAVSLQPAAQPGKVAPFLAPLLFLLALAYGYVREIQGDALRV